jgi:hypothetical protein
MVEKKSIASRAHRSYIFVEIALILALVLLAWIVAREYLQETLFAWGDHPGQFMRFWYPLAHAIPESGHWLWGVISWNPTWYAGYPEIQFYPPGTTLLGILLHYLTLGRLSAEQVYNFIPALAFVLPLFTCYAFLRYALAPLGRLPSILGGLCAGLLAISLKPMWGGIDGVLIGLMGERLAFGFAPLVMLAGWWFVERPSPRSLAITSMLLAILLLLHPFHAPAVVVAVALYSAFHIEWRTTTSLPPLRVRLIEKFAWLLGWVLFAVGLVAWWLVPLLAHYTPYAAGLVRATTDQVISWFDAGRLEWIWLTALMALMLLAHQNRRIAGTVSVIALLAPLLVGGILFNDQILLARFNITMLDPIRFIAEYFLALLLLTGCAVAAITSSFLWRIRWLATICTIVVIVTLRPYVELAWNDVRTIMDVAPTSLLSNIRQHPAFNGFWDALQNDPTQGRIFFVSNYLQLTWDDGVVTPTTINSMTPYFTNREIVGGTFSHWSPVARWLWVGDPRAELLPAQVESGDNRQLFGKPWEEITAEQLAADLTRLNVTTIVVGANDQKAREMFDASPHFAYYWHNDHFSLYHLASNDGLWFEASGASATLIERTARRWVIDIRNAEPNALLQLRQAHYPLWQATVNGNNIPIWATPESLQLIQLPAEDAYTLEVAYREGTAEWTGLAVTVGSILIAAPLIFRRRRG